MLREKTKWAKLNKKAVTGDGLENTDHVPTDGHGEAVLELVLSV